MQKYHNLYNDTRTITNRINRDVEKQKEIALRNTARLTALFGCKNLSVCRDLTPRLSVQGTAHSGTDAAAAGEIVPHRMLSLRGNRCNRERGLQIHTENAPTLRERVTISTTRIQKSTSRFWGNKLLLRGTIITAKLCRNRLTDRFDDIALCAAGLSRMEDRGSGYRSAVFHAMCPLPVGRADSRFAKGILCVIVLYLASRWLILQSENSRAVVPCSLSFRQIIFFTGRGARMRGNNPKRTGGRFASSHSPYPL